MDLGLRHSSVGAFHGLSPAGSPLLALFTMHHTHASTDSPKMNAPTVDS
jgi:hypothetical protein